MMKNILLALVGLICLHAGLVNAMESDMSRYTLNRKLREVVSQKGERTLQNIQEIQSLIEAGADVNAKNNNETKTPLELAVLKNDATGIEVLITTVSPQEAQQPDIVNEKLALARKYLPDVSEATLYDKIRASIDRVSSKNPISLFDL